MEIWGGIECTINRVYNQYFDQLEYQGHYSRKEDMQLIGELGFKKMRYPVLWEKHQAKKNRIEWGNTEENLLFLKNKNIEPIAGLIHHGSGPDYVHMLEDSFAEGLANYAEQVALKFPWINYYTPVNEPLTTARFCGLYGLWYPHATEGKSFLRILVNECKATILAMLAIRKVNASAKLVYTEDLSKIHSTSLLKYQADFENERRWLSIDLICGKVTSRHCLRPYLIEQGISETELDFFVRHAMTPDILGFNYYITSERYLDERTEFYPEQICGGNEHQKYADVEAVRVAGIQLDGPGKILKVAWEKYGLPMAVTEAHLNSGREDQLRWLQYIWDEANVIKSAGVNIIGVTVWSLFGAFGWDRLLTVARGSYESGVYDISTGILRQTALADLVCCLAQNSKYEHPVMNGEGWWQTERRIIYPQKTVNAEKSYQYSCAPVLIFGTRKALGSVFATAFNLRNIYCRTIEINELNLSDCSQIRTIIKEHKPWAIIDASGYDRMDIADFCSLYQIKLVTFSSDPLFNSEKINGSMNGNLMISPAYVTDLVNVTINLLIDNIPGIWHINYSNVCLSKSFTDDQVNTSPFIS